MRGVRISALNENARQSGIHQDMSLSDARALLPSLVTKPAELEADVFILNKLANWCQRYTPVVSVDGSDGLWLDITGAAHLSGGETNLLTDLSNHLDKIGFENRLGLANTAGAAWAIARFGNDTPQTAQIISSSDVSRALAPLPLEALRLDGKAVHLLRRFGIKTVGALHDLPRASLKRRFPSKDVCKAVLHRLDQAFGLVAEPITPLRTAPDYFERLSFHEPILATESFRVGLHDLLERLAWRMEEDVKGATRLTFSAYHADGGVSQITIATARPSRDVNHLAHLFRDKLEGIHPGFGVDVLVLSAHAVEPLNDEQMMFSGGAENKPSQKNVDQLIDRLSNRLGAHSVQRIACRESHVPERAEQRFPALQGVTDGAQNPDSKPLRPSRLLTRPEPVDVMAEVPEGPPMRFKWRRVMHRVVRAEGPERIAPEWWHASWDAGGNQQRTRDYYRVEDEQGRCFWLFREGLYREANETTLPTWHMHGLFA